MLATRAMKRVNARDGTNRYNKRRHQLANDTSRVETGSCEKSRFLFSIAFRLDTVTAPSTEAKPTANRNCSKRADDWFADRMTTVVPMKEKKRRRRKNTVPPHRTKSCR